MGRVGILRVALALFAWTGLSAFALADDWMVDRLRGEVLVMTHGAWMPLQRGDIVSDSSRIRSAEGSRVTFTRGAEAIELDGATEIRIFDKQGERMTTIMQAYGSVTVEAERLQIQHFSVQTPFLAAIVKGTRFTVRSDDSQSSVDVARGLVQVQDYTHGVATDIAPGQSAVVSNDIVLDVSGGGAHAPMVTLDGQVVPAADGQDNSSQGNQGQGNNGNHGQGNNGNGGDNNGNGNGNGNSGSNGNGGNSGNAGNHGNSGNSGNSGNAGNSGNGNGGGNNGNAGNNGNKGNNGQGKGNGSK
ncbi:FecR family protein [Devosia sp.]|uniref:FecR family protein n=1 Tax=Devosia sp. TaxID=1871048 RepID=UPI001A07D4E4|nr:FecR family protein [Devosia sp.]MBE0581362.1 FecR domain-containing protein [Devosia sp.]